MRKTIAVCAVGLCLAFFVGSAHAQASYTTQHNDNMRTGDNLSETILNQSNVKVSTFGMLFKETVDDQVYATPLYVPNLTINGAGHNAVFVATVNNTVYAFDADKGGAALWSRNFGTPPNHTQVGQGGSCGPGNYNDFVGNIGIVGTPVIDASSDTMYFVARTVSGTTFTQTLHAISILTGADRASNPSVVISGGAFNAKDNNQRPALTFANSKVYIAWSSHCDVTPYNGFVMAYTASTLAQAAVFNDTSTGGANGQAGIWQSGQGLNVDSSGNIYVMTGNGTWDGSSNFGESFVKLNPTNLTVEDYFTPSDYASLNSGDVDLGSAGGLLIPGTSLIVGGGKAAIFYLLNTGNMGHETGSDTGAVQEFKIGNASCGSGEIHGSPVYYDSSSLGPLIYVWSDNDYMHEFKFNGSTFPSTTPYASSSMTDAECGDPGVMLSVSADGNNDSTAIVWGNGVLSGDAGHGTVPGILRAFNATNVNQELWDSQQNASRDSCGNFAKYAYPAVVNGKVYLGSFGTANAGSGQLCVYGLITPVTEGPYGGTPAAIPGTVQAENYDTGGQGVGYSVTSTNGTANSYRSDGVDLEVTTDTGGGYNLGWTAAGQWFKYTVNVATAGAYTVTFRVAAPAAVTDAFHISNSSGTNLSGSVNVPATGGYQAWVNVTATVTLPAGTQTLTINQDKAGWNINWFAFASGGPPPTSIAINSGGLAVSPFAADEDFAGGTESSTATTITTTGVTNPAPEAVYQSQRFGNFTYTIPGYTAGSNHTVVLYFDEFYWTAAGKRVFNVSINGTQVLTNFDVFAAAGGEFKAIDKTFTATANASGQIVIVFTTVTDNAEVNGISVQ